MRMNLPREERYRQKMRHRRRVTSQLKQLLSQSRESNSMNECGLNRRHMSHPHWGSGRLVLLNYVPKTGYLCQTGGSGMTLTDRLAGGRHSTLLQECFELIRVIRHGAMSETIEGDHPPPTKFFEFAKRDAQEACGFLSRDMRDSTSHPVVVRDSLHGMWVHVEGLSGSTERTMSASCLAVGSLPFISAGNFDWS